MRSILSIILIIALLAPNAARWLALSACKTDFIAGKANGFCLCEFNNLFTDNKETSLPNNQKEITEQTDWKYITEGLFRLRAPVDNVLSNYPDAAGCYYTCSFLKNIFHPPCIG